MKVELDINKAEARRVEVEPRMSLLDCLRDNLQLNGAHTGCEHGVCGACTRADRRHRGALLPDVRRAGRRVTPSPPSRPVARAGRTVHLAGCVLRDPRHAVRLLHAGDDPRGALAAAEEHLADPRGDRRVAISGNICRCTGYAQIVEAIALAADACAARTSPGRERDAMSAPGKFRFISVRPPRARGPPLRGRQGQLRRRHRARWASSTWRW